MRTKFIIIAGAGATLSDAKNASIKRKPPLDKGFFSDVKKLGYQQFLRVSEYLNKTYDFDPTSSERDSLEGVMSILYADIHNPLLEAKALPAFRSLIRLFNRRIAETTNEMKPTYYYNLYKIICRLLDNGLSPGDICIITFNQDLQIEKILQKIQSTNRTIRHGRIFNFPYCYNLQNADSRLSNPSSKSVQQFDDGDSSEPILRILKLHGSLNWYSLHHSRNVTKGSILNPQRKFNITSRVHINVDMTYSGPHRREHTFPLIIPPVTHKAGILHKDIIPIWSAAEISLKNAHRILIFGYSCPELDFESANLFRRTVRKNKKLKAFCIIDPNSLVFQRYVELTQLDSLHYYKNVDSYLKEEK